ncbi:Cytochrome c oxidase subunit 1 [Aquicella siphonis]|uniref:Cytochrome c oxidase subunit 1 n=1 Tax=Aquicella siphonis TaxID=254247 RepID=A0A5E4PGU0_9COXI|nr:cytochrome c oxidase subunit I [Aquicella siphonis]VVC75576.1 Cytochrome c oxidase subunit 1 [Aquicella siphonis]
MNETAHVPHHPETGFKRWLYTTNHKDIGTLYLVFSLVMLFVGGILALLIRVELFKPELVLFNPEIFNQMTTLHGLIMIFGVIMPAMTGIANWMVPLMIGAPDMALPRLNNWSFWLLPCAFSLLISTLFMNGPAPDFGWTFYAPLSSTYGPRSTDFLIFTIHMLGISSILSALNIVVTIFNMRAPGMHWMKLPMFVWSWLVTAFLLLAVMPILAGCVTMVLMDRHFHTSFFNAAGGGDPILFQHLFWFFGHPEVYILILPGFGIISAIIPTFARKPLFGYRLMVLAITVIALLAFLVWMHHMFTTGAPYLAQIITMYLTMLIAVPTGIKIFNWIATLYKGSITFETPMLFALGFLVMFTVGGLSGVMLSLVPSDYQYRDSYFVVGHFHYVLVSGSLFSIIAGVYYWLPKWTGRMYNETLGQMHFWMTVIGLNLTFFPMHFLGLAGMPRRVPDYAIQYTSFNQLSTVGAFIFGFAQLFFLYNILKTCMRKTSVQLSDKVWDGAEGLEWTVPSPAPYHTFEVSPSLK